MSWNCPDIEKAHIGSIDARGTEFDSGDAPGTD
jgi:hypothetical protein